MKTTLLFYSLVLLLGPACSLQAQPDPIENGEYWHNYPKGLEAIVTAPANWDSAQWRKVAILAGITGGLFLADETLRDTWQDDIRGSATDTMADIARPFGSNTSVAAGSLALYGAGVLTDNTRTQETGLLALQGMLLSNLTLEGIKLLAHRRRPADSPDDAHHWGGPGLDSGDKSFASGHSAKAFMLASVIAAQYPDNGPLQVAAYGMASLTALSRVNDDRHWASDVVAGAAIGYAIGHLVTNLDPFGENSRLTLTPGTPDGSNGLALNFRF